MKLQTYSSLEIKISLLSKVQIQSGEIAGNLAADVTLTSTKKSLDDLTKALVREFNEVHRFGVDLNGDQGCRFFHTRCR